MKTSTILIIEDEQRIAYWIRTHLELSNFRVLTAEDGISGLKMAMSENPDLIILDLMLPGMDGLAVCRAVRQESDVPIIILSARGSEQDRILGLQLGADDYMVKPFNPEELVVRAQAVLRRTQRKKYAESKLYLNGIEVNVDAHTCSVDGHEVSLSRTQFDLLVALMQNAGRVLSREELMKSAFNQEYINIGRTIDTYIRRLRKQIETNPSEPKRISTVYGIGYRFERE